MGRCGFVLASLCGLLLCGVFGGPLRAGCYGQASQVRALSLMRGYARVAQFNAAAYGGQRVFFDGAGNVVAVQGRPVYATGAAAVHVQVFSRGRSNFSFRPRSRRLGGRRSVVIVR